MKNTCFRNVLRSVALAVPVAMLTLSGCKKGGGEDDDVLTVTPWSLNIQPDGGRKSVTVKSSSDWLASTEADWLTITQSSTGKAFSVSAGANPREDVRHAVISVTNISGLKQEVSVSQTGITPALEVSSRSVELDAQGTAATVAVATNVELRIQTEDAWLNAAMDGDNLVISSEPTPLFEPREGSVKLVPVIEDYADLAVEISVKQAAQKYSLLVVSESVADGKITVDAAEKSIAVSVVANSDWTVSSDAEWIEFDPAEGPKTDDAGVSVLVNIAESFEPTSREAEIVFACGDAEYKIPVLQRSAGIYLEMDNSPITVTDAQSTFTRSVETNGTVSFEYSDSWLSAAFEDGEIKISVEANTGDKRTARLTVVSSSGGTSKSEIIEVSQMAFAVNLSENGTANCYVVPRAGAYKIKATVKGNGATTEMLDRVDKTINPNGAMIVWATDTTGCISNVALSGEWLYFETDGTDGNAVIAATFDEYSQNPDEEPYRTVLWSWHIWMTGFDIEAPLNQYETGGDGTFGIPAVFMGRNLGALSSGESGTVEDLVGSFGMQYQWGRKDPFPAAGEIKFDPRNETNGNTEGTNMSTATTLNSIIYFYYDKQDGVPYRSSAVSIPSMYVENTKVRDNIAFAIENPHTFIKSSKVANKKNAYMWTSSSFFDEATLNPLDEIDPWGHLWGNPTDNVMQVGEKSIYDPCPVGWQVPAPYQWAFISGHGDDLAWWYGANFPWVYNHKEAESSLEAGKIRINDPKALEAAGGTLEARKKYGYVRMTTMKGGFNIYYTSHHTGAEAENAWTQVLYDSYATGPTMFLPAAGLRSYLGYNIRTGFGAQYHSSSVYKATNDLTDEFRLKARGVCVDYQGHQFFKRNYDYDQQANARSVRCVKSDF